MLTDEEIEWFRRVRSAMGHSPDEASKHVQALLTLSEHSPTLSAIVEEHRMWALIRRRVTETVKFVATLGAAIAAAGAFWEWWRRQG